MLSLLATPLGFATYTFFFTLLLYRVKGEKTLPPELLNLRGIKGIKKKQTTSSFKTHKLLRLFDK